MPWFRLTGQAGRQRRAGGKRDRDAAIGFGQAERAGHHHRNRSATIGGGEKARGPGPQIIDIGREEDASQPGSGGRLYCRHRRPRRHQVTVGRGNALHHPRRRTRKRVCLPDTLEVRPRDRDLRGCARERAAGLHDDLVRREMLSQLGLFGRQDRGVGATCRLRAGERRVRLRRRVGDLRTGQARDRLAESDNLARQHGQPGDRAGCRGGDGDQAARLHGREAIEPRQYPRRDRGNPVAQGGKSWASASAQPNTERMDARPRGRSAQGVTGRSRPGRARPGRSGSRDWTGP